jgi:hypothetical protein
MLELRYFTTGCNNAEYKKIQQDTSLGQLYEIQNEMKILYKAKVGPTHFLLHTVMLSVVEPV